MNLTRHGLEQRLTRLEKRLQMFGDRPWVGREPSDAQLHIEMVQSLPGFGLDTRGQVRIIETWNLVSGSWFLDYYVYDYERFAGHEAGAGLFGYHCHQYLPGDPSGGPVAHIKVEDGSGRDPHYQSAVVDADAAIDRFFLMDACGERIHATGLRPFALKRRTSKRR